MATQNLISAELLAEKQASVVQKLKEVLADLDFLLSLQTDEVKGIFKAGNNYLPFIEKAHYVVNSHPEILPSVFNAEEFNKDYTLAKSLSPIVNMSGELSRGLERTNIAVNSDLLTVALEVYSITKINRDRVPGLSAIADEMAVFFQKSRKSAAATKETA